MGDVTKAAEAVRFMALVSSFRDHGNHGWLAPAGTFKALV